MHSMINEVFQEKKTKLNDSIVAMNTWQECICANCDDGIVQITVPVLYVLSDEKLSREQDCSCSRQEKIKKLQELFFGMYRR